MPRQRTFISTGPIRRIVGETPSAHADAPALPVAWQGDEALTLWPNAGLAGVHPGGRWVRLSTGADALFLRAHDWLPPERGRFLSVRLVEEPSGAVRPVEHGCLPLADVVAMLRPAPARTARAAVATKPGRLRRAAAEAGAVALAAFSLGAGALGAATLALELALR